MINQDYAALEIAALECENRKDWRTAFGYWKQAITEFGKKVSKDQVAYWTMHMEDCDKKMK